MNLWAFLVGFIIGFVPVFMILRYFRGKFLFVENMYAKGALFGFLLWFAINLFLFLEATYALFGFLKGESGMGTYVVLNMSYYGFITSGLVSAFLVKKLGARLKKS